MYHRHTTASRKTDRSPSDLMSSVSGSHTPLLRVKRLGGWSSKESFTGLVDRIPRFRAFLRAPSLEIVACPFKW